MVKVAVQSIKDKTIEKATRLVMDACNWQDIIKENDKVVIKLNLCAADSQKIESSNTDIRLTEALCKIIQEKTKNIYLVESNGYRYYVEEAFKCSGVYDLGNKLGVNVVSLSDEPCQEVGNDILGPLPEILLNNDVFITMPVLKTHALTYFTGSLKNQWGCLPQFDRISKHWALDQLLVDLHKILKPKLCIMDGIVGQDDRGPTNGRKRKLDIILCSTDGVALDSAAMRLVGLKPEKAKHIAMAHEAGVGDMRDKKIKIEIDFEPYWEPYIPAQLDWAVRGMNNLSKYEWFRHHILEIEPIFQAGKKVVQALRKIGIVR